MAGWPLMPAVAAAIGALLATAPAQAVSDLGAVIASAPSVVVVGTSWEVTWGAQNVGDPLLPGAVALSVEVELYLSDEAMLGDGELETLLASQMIPVNASWQPGESRTLTSSLSPFTNSQVGTWYLVAWVKVSDDDGTNDVVVSPVTVRLPQLVVSRSGTGSGSVSSIPSGISCGDICEAQFPPGIPVELVATPAADSAFLGWSGDCTGSGLCTVNLGMDRQVDAKFGLTQGEATLAAAFTFSPTTPVAGEPVQFTDLSTGGPVSWSWEFGDGSVSTQQHPSHAYSVAGEFTARLTVSWDGVSDTATRVVTVAEAPGVVSLVLDVAAVREGQGAITVGVRRETAFDTAVSVVLELRDGTARRGEDYDGPPTIALEWSAGDSSSRTVPITILDDASIEAPETFFVELSSPQGLVLGDPSAATLLVLDDDFAIRSGELEIAGPAESPVVAARDDGARVYVWQRPDGDGNGVFARAFADTGAPIGDAFALAGDGRGDQSAPSVSWDDRGNLVVLWLDDGGAETTAARSTAAAEESGVLGATFTPQGEPLGPPVALSGDVDDATTPSVNVDRAGEAVVVWHEPGGPRGRVLDRDHLPVGDVFEIAATGPGVDSKPDADRSAMGDFVVVWLDTGEAGRVRARLYGPHGNAKNASFTVVPDTTADNPVVAISDDGGFVVAWDAADDAGARDVLARRFDRDGEPRGAVFVVHEGVAGDQRSPRIDANSVGDFVVTFESDVPVPPAGATADSGSVLGRVFDAAGVPLGDEVEVVAGEGGTVPGNADVALDDEDNATVVFERRGPGEVSEGLGSKNFHPPIATAACEVADAAEEAHAIALCLQAKRFRVTAHWQDRAAKTLPGRAAPLTADTGLFWFFDPGNVELVVRVLDACALNGRFWVFAGGLTDLEVDLVVDDTWSGVSRTYFNALGRGLEPILDTTAFATCSVAAVAVAAEETPVATGSGSDRVAASNPETAAAGSQPRAASDSCVPGEQALCLSQSRFEVRATWRTADGDGGEAGVVALSPDSGYLWFFGRDGVEIVIKVLDGCALNDKFWVFAGGPTDVEVELVVTDTRTGSTRVYASALGQPFRIVRDTSAFPCS